MELNDLKSAWEKLSSKDAKKYQLGEEAILDMLKKRTKNLIERIDRNIKIGFFVLLLLSVFFVLDSLILTPYLAKERNVEIPSWVFLTDAINTLFILGTFIYFSVRYYSVKKSYSQTSNLRNVLKGIVKLLNTYRVLFYLAVTILLFVVGVNFVTGMFSGLEMAAKLQGGLVQDLNASQVASRVTIGIIILFAFTGGLFWFFSWGFRRLYGNYINKLNDTLNELDEIG